MKEVIYSKYGEAVPDFHAEEYARKILTQDVLHTSCETVFNWIRVMVKEGELDPKDVKFVYVDPYTDVEETLNVHYNGTLNHWPTHLGGSQLDALSRLLAR